MASYDAGYCNKSDIKSRLLISDSTYDTEIVDAGKEASHFIDDKLRPYITPDATEESAEPFVFRQVPLTNDTSKIPAEISIICADLGAGIFKRRHMPQDLDAQWWINGVKKLEEFIKSTFHKGVFKFC